MRIARTVSYVMARSQGSRLPDGLPITINFHPDAMHNGRLTIEALAGDGVYRSQFETGTSNGGLTAHPGGDRWLWESRMFGTAYDAAAPSLRPKYGALNYRGDVTGGSPRFGSSHLRLRPNVLARATFCYPDSFLNPRHFGIAERFGLVDLAERDRGFVDALDSYVEAHVHGPLVLADDVEALVLDPSYRGSRVEAVAASLPCPIEWHPGFEMTASRVADCVEYRGAAVAALAAGLMNGGTLTPRHIGAALKDGASDPQLLKRVWHCVARFGRLG